MTKSLVISSSIAAPSDVVRRNLGRDPHGRMVRGVQACEWHDGYDGPVVGATFDGHNRHGEHEWTTQCKVIELTPSGLRVECSRKDFHDSTWGGGYRIEPTESRCRVTDWNENLLPASALEQAKQISGVDVRTERNRQTMSGTLERLADALKPDRLSADSSRRKVLAGVRLTRREPDAFGRR